MFRKTVYWALNLNKPVDFFSVERWRNGWVKRHHGFPSVLKSRQLSCLTKGQE